MTHWLPVMFYFFFFFIFTHEWTEFISFIFYNTFVHSFIPVNTLLELIEKHFYKSWQKNLYVFFSKLFFFPSFYKVNLSLSRYKHIRLGVILKNCLNFLLLGIIWRHFQKKLNSRFFGSTKFSYRSFCIINPNKTIWCMSVTFKNSFLLFLLEYELCKKHLISLSVRKFMPFLRLLLVQNI